VEGWEVGVIHSTTYEEANTQVGNWIRQRSRWIKGYMQTTLVHTRNPWQLIRRVGLRKAAGFLLLVGGTPLTFLSAPWMWAMFLWWVITQTRALDPFFPPPVLYISLFNLLFGNAIAIYLNMLAGFKRGYYDLIPWALLTPVYWVLHSIAAYKALWQLFTRPFYWEKTRHGISHWLRR
jgi:cellulose synthase/poly-beta-1,6-N-acetylglucosamine synthase-like glycosyltransferase